MKYFKLQIAIISAVAIAALAMLYVQQQTIKELRKDNEALKQEAAQVASLQEQLAGATQAAAGGASTQEGQTRELARLRNEVSQLRKQTNELVKAKQDIQTLNQRLAAESEARKGAVADAQAAATAQADAKLLRAINSGNACINNLRLIDSAKQQWALEFRKQATDTPTMDDLKPYLGRGANGEMPTCPNAGAYTVGAVNEKPTCSVAGHVLP